MRMAKIKKLRKQRHHSPKENGAPSIAASINVNVDTQQQGGNNDPTSPVNGGSSKRHISKIDTLISQLHEDLDQGRIFDARSLVQKLRYIERNEPGSSSKLMPVRHLMEEVITQSDHVESLLHELHSDDDWTLAKELSGVTVHYRRDPNSPIHTVRAVTTFDNFSPKDFVRLCSLFVETECMHLWFPGGIMKKANLLSWHSKYAKVVQLRISLGLPMVSPRDAIVLGNGYHLRDRNAFLISSKTILEDTCRYCDIPTPRKGVVRMATESIFYVQLMKSDVISFKMIGKDDLKLKYMPSTLLNYLSQGHLPFDLMKTIHKTIRNFNGSVWEEKIQARGAYYTEIEDKVYEQLKMWEKDGTSVSPKTGIGEKSDGNVDANVGMPRPIFETSENERQAEDGPLSAVSIAVALFAVISSTLYAMAFPENLPILAAHDSSEALRTANLLLAIIVSSLILPVIMLMSLLVRVKQPRNNADPNVETEKMTVKLNNPKARCNGSKESAKTDASPGRLNSRNQSNEDTSSPNKSDIITNKVETLLEEITPAPHSTQPSGPREQKLSNRSLPSSQPKLRKMRSSLNGFRGMKRMASLQLVTGKKKARSKRQIGG